MLKGVSVPSFWQKFKPCYQDISITSVKSKAVQLGLLLRDVKIIS